MKLNGNMQINLSNGKKITLRPNDHIATGGEGSVYKKGKIIIKLYSDIDRMLKNNFVKKIELLSKINHPSIIAPQGVAVDYRHKPIGFFMPLAKGEALTRFFTNNFRQQENFGDAQTTEVAKGMRKVVEYAHQNKMLLVDANELNWLVDYKQGSKPNPLAIDVDSWSFGKWKPQVIMPSIRDWHSNSFNQLTDWFAWGVVTFQLYTGIHPYKGKLSGYKPIEMERRMKNNTSVFTKGVRLNRAVRDFGCIPAGLMDWYYNTFQKGLRTIPPTSFDKCGKIMQTARIMYATVNTFGLLIFDRLYKAKKSDLIRKVFVCGVVWLNSGELIDLSTQRSIGRVFGNRCEVIEVKNGWLVADITSAKVNFFYINSTSLQSQQLVLPAKFRRVFRYENRLFVVTENRLNEIVLHNFSKPILSLKESCGILGNSTKWFDGVGVQDSLGAMYLITPFGQKSVAQVRAKELDGLKPLVAKAGERFVTVAAIDTKGLYRKLEFAFDTNYQNYKFWQGGTDDINLNIAILPKGVCATIVDDGQLDIFVPSSGAVNKISDKNISTKMILNNWGDKVLCHKDDCVWQVRLK